VQAQLAQLLSRGSTPEPPHPGAAAAAPAGQAMDSPSGAAERLRQRCIAEIGVELFDEACRMVSGGADPRGL
jgi:hypothetical protein